jgi:hypothetical protein
MIPLDEGSAIRGNAHQVAIKQEQSEYKEGGKRMKRKSPLLEFDNIKRRPGEWSKGVFYKGKKRSAEIIQMPIPTKLSKALADLYEAGEKKIREPTYEAIEKMIEEKGGHVDL